MDDLGWVARALTGRLRASSAPPRDWGQVQRIASRGGLGPLLLSRAQDQLPGTMREVFEAERRKAAFAGLRALRERDRLLGALHEAGIDRVVLLKGAVLGWLTYPDPILRPMLDLDLLVRARDEAAAVRALVELGYREENPFGGRRASHRANHERLFGLELIPGRLRLAVELHTAFAQSFRYRVPYDRVIQRALPFAESPGGYRLEGSDQLLHLAIHMAREQFLGPLKHLLDVHHWVARGELDWQAVIARALRWGAATATDETLRLASLVFGTRIPREVPLALGPGRVRGTWLRWLHRPQGDRLVRGAVPMRAAQSAALLPLMDTNSQRARFLATYARLRLRDLWPAFK